MEELNALLNAGVTGVIVKFLLRLVLVVVIFIIGVQLIKLVRKIVRKSMERAHAEKGVMQFVDSFIKAALYLLLIFMLAANLGMDAASIVALLGSAGVAIGLAVQGSLSNLAGGVLILLLKPFKVGDYIIETTGKQEGVVTEIQIFYTKLATADNRIVILPNGNLSNSSLVNVTAADKRRLDVMLQISYEADLKQAKEALLEVLKQDEKSLKEQEMLVYVDALAESGVALGVRCWVKTEDYWPTKWRISENCKLALDKAGIDIPYPQLDVHMKEGGLIK
ncbi:MAG: mechanosensitive ion channel [Roseburia sp.]|nr:mechanosensitive ion channel [Roseburia sp.]